MARYDASKPATVTASINPQTIASNTTVNGTGVDVGQASEILCTWGVGARTDGTYTPTLQESADNSSWSNVAAADMQGAPAAISAANTLQQVAYLGTRQFVRWSIASTSVTSGAQVSGHIIARGRRKQP